MCRINLRLLHAERKQEILLWRIEDGNLTDFWNRDWSKQKEIRLGLYLKNILTGWRKSLIFLIKSTPKYQKINAETHIDTFLVKVQISRIKRDSYKHPGRTYEIENKQTNQTLNKTNASRFSRTTNTIKVTWVYLGK